MSITSCSRMQLSAEPIILVIRTPTFVKHILTLLGTESETVPMNTLPGQLYNLTCPDSKSYYKHKGASTTAEYYINNQGVDVEDACSWGKDGTNRGNWAPTYVGVGADLYGKTWVSIASTEQNDPTNHQPLNYTITLTGEGLSGKCRLKNDKYCSGDNYETCSSGQYAGCTVSGPCINLRIARRRILTLTGGASVWYRNVCLLG